MLKIFSASILLNVVLIPILWMASQQHDFQAAVPTMAEPRQELSPRISTAAKRNSFWSRLESRDLNTFIDSLRSIGCPEAIIRNLVTGLINRNFDSKKQVLRRVEDFWIDGEEKKSEVRRRVLALIELEKERERAIEATLQIAWYRAPLLDNEDDLSQFFTSFIAPARGGSCRTSSLRRKFRPQVSKPFTPKMPIPPLRRPPPG